jgi:hypothetical protein
LEAAQPDVLAALLPESTPSAKQPPDVRPQLGELLLPLEAAESRALPEA